MLKNIPQIQHLESNNFFLIAGPCVLESKDNAWLIAETLKNITDRLKIPFIFKASYRKANRTRNDSFSGIGDMLSLKILKEISERLKVPVITDIHSVSEAQIAAIYVDVLQIPAFLCRQTDILVAAAKTGKTINVKKGQFLSPEAMKFVAQKIVDAGNKNIMLTERGVTFGYQDLIVDFRSIPIMQKTGFPTVLDVTHSLQQPNQNHGVSGGQPEMIETIARAGIAVGVDGIFVETHPKPAEAKSDGANMLPLDKMEKMLENLVKIREVVKTF